MARESPKNTPRSILLPFGVLALCAIVWPAMVTFDPGDWPSPDQFPHMSPAANACGPAGAWLAYHLRYYLGDGAYPLLLFGTLASILRLVRGEVGNFWERALGLILIVACTAASTQLISAPGSAPLLVGNGGVMGFVLAELLAQNLSSLGTLIVISAAMFVGLLFATEGWILTLPTLLRRVGRASGDALAVAGQAAAARIPRVVPLSEGLSGAERNAILVAEPPGRRHTAAASRPASEQRRSTAGPSRDEEDADRADRLPGDDDSDRAALPTREVPAHPAPTVSVDRGEETEPDEAECDADDDSVTSHSQPSVESRPQAAAKAAIKFSAPIVRFPTARQAAVAEPYPRQVENWRLPALSLLQDPEYGFTSQQEAAVREQARVLERTLEEFRLDARVVEIDTGPVITMFELKLGAGIKVSQIAVLSNDIARALKAHAIRVVAPISGKNTVGIEVPNVTKEKVRLKELMQLAGKKVGEMGLPLFLGKDAAGAALVADLTKMPHLLIAGTTGSGKSVCLNAVILSLLMTKRPDHVKLILIDPKMVEMSQYKEVPHLMCPIVTDIARAEKILEWSVTQMDERYEMLAEARVKNIAGYNELGADELYRRLEPGSDQERARIAMHLPYIVIIIDELADLMMTAPREVEHHLSRLAQKSRAVGIHIMVATQRPEVKVVTGLIKSNLPSRICFRVASRMDSRIVLDQNGGEVLMGQGDMLFLPPGSHKLLRAQGTYLEDAEVQAVLDDLASRAQPQFHPELVRLPAAGGDADSGLRDPLFDEAVRIVLESRRGSVSLLQRRLTIGYSRASRLIDQMADGGIVGDYKGSQAREVSMTLDQWDALRKRVDAEEGLEAEEARGTARV